MDDAEHVAFNVVLLQQAPGTHHLGMGRSLSLRDPVGIVQFPWPVQAQANVEAFCREETTPVLVYEGTVRLDAVRDLAVRGSMLPLYLDNPAKEVDAQDCGLAAVPREVDE